MKRRIKKTARRKPAARAKTRKTKSRKTSRARRTGKIARRVTKPKASKPIGEVTHFYNEIGVAIVRFKQAVPLGTVLYFRGATTDFKHPAQSMQYDHKPIALAPKGKQIGIKVPERVREGDKVHRA